MLFTNGLGKRATPSPNWLSFFCSSKPMNSTSIRMGWPALFESSFYITTILAALLVQDPSGLGEIVPRYLLSLCQRIVG